MRISAAVVAVGVLIGVPRSGSAQWTAALVPAAVQRTHVASAVRPPAGVAAVRAAFIDSAAGSLDATSGVADAGDSVFHDGATPPLTRSELPLLALAGAGTLLIGVALSRR